MAGSNNTATGSVATAKEVLKDEVFNVKAVQNNASKYKSNFTQKSISDMFIPIFKNYFSADREKFLNLGAGFASRKSRRPLEYLKYTEPGAQFFRVFFDFKTHYGLFGGIINDTQESSEKSVTNGIQEYNTASMYLQNNISSPRFSPEYRGVLIEKQKSLFKFAEILHFLVNDCPWVFREVGGIEGILNSNFVEIAKRENNQIQLNLMDDSIDMRLSTLLNLYKHACFDYTNFKEIIPENLRKFDMSILIYTSPTIKLPETYKCLVLKNCEIIYKDLKTVNDVLSNENGFQNKLTLKIDFERSFIYDVNKVWGVEILDLIYDENAVKSIKDHNESMQSTLDYSGGISEPVTSPSTEAPTDGKVLEYYKVKSGDCLAKIASDMNKKHKLKNKLTYDDIYNANLDAMKKNQEIYKSRTGKFCKYILYPYNDTQYSHNNLKIPLK